MSKDLKVGDTVDWSWAGAEFLGLFTHGITCMHSCSVVKPLVEAIGDDWIVLRHEHVGVLVASFRVGEDIREVLEG